MGPEPLPEECASHKADADEIRNKARLDESQRTEQKQPPLPHVEHAIPERALKRRAEEENPAKRGCKRAQDFGKAALPEQRRRVHEHERDDEGHDSEAHGGQGHAHRLRLAERGCGERRERNGRRDRGQAGEIENEQMPGKGGYAEPVNAGTMTAAQMR